MCTGISVAPAILSSKNCSRTLHDGNSGTAPLSKRDTAHDKRCEAMECSVGGIDEHKPLVAADALAIDVGDQAPDVVLHGTVGEMVRLSEYQGQKNGA